MQSARVQFRRVLLLMTLVTLPLCGCSWSGTDVTTREPGSLNELAKAYLAATNALNRPPANAEELQSYLPEGRELNSLLTCPVSGKPYVIVWGTDPRQGMDVKPLVIGYEPQSTGGSRFVFTAMGVMEMGDQDFKTAKFPAGHVPQ